MMTFSQAITRRPGPDCGQGLTTVGLGPPDFDLLRQQHQAYLDVLRALGLQVQELEALSGCPDAYFVEDVAVVTPELAVVTRPGAPSRRQEPAAMAPLLARFRPVATIRPPGTLEGGDVLVVGRQVFIGLSERTNAAGAEQLGRLLKPCGYTWTTIPVGEGLHLKSSVNLVGPDTLLVTPALAGCEAFAAYERIVVDEAESYAANVLWINDHLLIPGGFPRTRARLAALGRPLVELDVSEGRKMDGGLTCLSLRL